ncbi:cytochrome c oxidase assembly protein [Micromonospora echinofusca]|uniref:Cytochrome c oxidase assembly protein n=1 Tax=Micromonospora echinofusca TaxID=47858 RepID=A0ABS3VMN8_MICEH|nr:cytochrome c oxidase assembly protein [Micromonospora echinofusca]MBO4205816.1 cytochrome c oxidase assembly protein [Micromonospora echinofusca]
MTLAHGGGHDSVGVTPALVVPVLLALLYLVGLGRQRHDPRGWSGWRSAAFGTGVLLLAVAVTLPTDPGNFPGHMLGHLLIGMLAPLALVLGAPLTLLLRSVPAGTGRRLVHLLRSPPARWLGHPVTGLLLTAGGLWLLYLTPLYRATLTSPALHELVHLHFLLSGYLFAWSVAGPDPGPHRPRVPARLVVLGVAVVAHAVLAQLVHAGLVVDIPASPGELRAGAAVMYYGGDLAEILLALSLLVTWRPDRDGTHRPSDRDETRRTFHRDDTRQPIEALTPVADSRKARA